MTWDFLLSGNTILLMSETGNPVSVIIKFLNVTLFFLFCVSFNFQQDMVAQKMPLYTTGVCHFSYFLMRINIDFLRAGAIRF